MNKEKQENRKERTMKQDKYEKIRNFWCPNCGLKSLHFYRKDGTGVWGKLPIILIDEIWCSNCNFKITDKPKKTRKEIGEEKKQ